MRITKLKQNGITLISLIITIIILLILAGVTINTLGGENGLITKTSQATKEQKKAQYFEEINLEIFAEQAERQVQPKEEAFILSIQERIESKKWTASVLIGKENGATLEDTTNAEVANIIIVETKEGYEIIIDVSNSELKATIRDYFEKVGNNNRYTIIYDKNGGEGEEIEQQVIRKGFSVILKENTYTKTNYVFVGWCEDKKGEGQLYQSGSKFIPSKDTTLYAKWEQDVVTIEFNANAGEDTVTGTMDNIPVSKNKDTAIPKNTYEREGYSFIKWNTKADGTGIDYENETTINTSENTTLYAIWQINTYTVTLNKEGTGELTGAGTYKYGSKVIINAESTNEFIGWYNGNIEYSKNKTVELTITGNMNLTAKFRMLVTGITLNNGSTVLSSSSTISGNYTNIEQLNDIIQLSATISPSNATNKNLIWTSSNTNIATVSDTGLVTFKGISGSTKTCVITCKSEDGNSTSSVNLKVSGYKDYWFYRGIYPYTLSNCGTIDMETQLQLNYLNRVTNIGNGFTGLSGSKINFDNYSKIYYSMQNLLDKTSIFQIGYSDKAISGITNDFGNCDPFINITKTESGIVQGEGVIPSGIGEQYMLFGQSGDNISVGWEYIYLYKDL